MVIRQFKWWFNWVILGLVVVIVIVYLIFFFVGQKGSIMIFGIICVMLEELYVLSEWLIDCIEIVLGGKIYLVGMIENQVVVLVEFGIGKVEVGIMVEYFIIDFKVDVVINFGLVGGIGEGLYVGDVVIVMEMVYYDVDVIVFGYEYG